MFCRSTRLIYLSYRHEHIGKGTLGVAPFRFIMQHPSWFLDMPLVLETPDDGPAVWRKETEMLYGFVGN